MVITDWHGIAPLGVEWERAFHEVVGRMRRAGIDVTRPLPHLDAGVDLAICAFAGADAGSEAVLTTLAELRERQQEFNEMRIAAIACGPSEPDIHEQDVLDALCSDAVYERRYAYRTYDPFELGESVGGLLELIAQEKTVGSLGLASSGDRNDSETLMAMASEREESVWMKSY